MVCVQNYYATISTLYRLLSNVASNVATLSIATVESDSVIYSSKLDEATFTLSKDMYSSNKNIVTAHILEEYKPSYLCIDKLIKESQKLIIDILLCDIGGLRGVPIQST